MSFRHEPKCNAEQTAADSPRKFLGKRIYKQYSAHAANIAGKTSPRRCCSGKSASTAALPQLIRNEAQNAYTESQRTQKTDTEQARFSPYAKITANGSPPPFIAVRKHSRQNEECRHMKRIQKLLHQNIRYNIVFRVCVIQNMHQNNQSN